MVNFDLVLMDNSAASCCDMRLERSRDWVRVEIAAGVCSVLLKRDFRLTFGCDVGDGPAAAWEGSQLAFAVGCCMRDTRLGLDRCPAAGGCCDVTGSCSGACWACCCVLPRGGSALAVTAMPEGTGVGATFCLLRVRRRILPMSPGCSWPAVDADS